MKIRVASGWAAGWFFASLMGCADVLGFQPFSVESNDASIDGGRVGSGRDSAAADATVSGPDARGDDAQAHEDALVTEGGPQQEAGCLASELNCGAGCIPNDAHNCGTCGHDCTNLSNVSGAVACSAGACAFDAGACRPGFAHCSGSADLGCETGITTKAACGACGQACAVATPNCAGSGTTYSCVSGCPAATPTLCGSSCVATATDASNCGKCSNPCTTTVAHASATCSGGTCGYACTASYPNMCSGQCVDFQGDSSNCGGCGKVCSTTVAGAAATCVSGSCKVQCTNPANTICGNACVDVKGTDNANCGACGTACSTAVTGATAACTGGSCNVSCTSSANTICGNACTNLQGTDAANCGACGHACAPGTCGGAGQCAKWSILAAAANNDPGPIASDGNYVAWANVSPGQCFVVPAAGATLGLQPTAFGDPGSASPNGVAIANGAALCLEDAASADEIWTIAEGGAAQSSATATLSGSDMGQPSSLTVNSTATQVFFQNRLLSAGATNNIYQCNISFSSSCSSIGSYAITFPPTGYHDIALAGSFVYAAEGTAGNLGQWSLSGSTSQNIATGQGSVQAVTADGSYVYWSFQGSTGTLGISRVPQSSPTSAATPIVSVAGGQPGPLATDGTNVYFVVVQGSTYTVEYAPAAGGSAVALTNTATTDIIEDIAVAKGALFWTQVPSSAQNGSIWGRHL